MPKLCMLLRQGDTEKIPILKTVTKSAYRHERHQINGSLKIVFIFARYLAQVVSNQFTFALTFHCSNRRP